MTPPIDEHSLQVDDATRARRRRFSVSARSESLFDAMLAMWSAFGADDKAQSHELGGSWFEAFRASVPAPTLELIAETGIDASMWPAVLSLVAADAPAGDDDTLIEWISVQPDLAGRICSETCTFGDQADLEAVVVHRDVDALERLLPTVKEKVRDPLATMLALPPAVFATNLAAILRSVLDDVYSPVADGWADAIASSAESVRMLEPTMKPNDLIERITNGLDYVIPLGMTGMVMVPTVSLRPWTLITEFDTTVIVSYSVSDDHMERDPNAAPGWLVRFHKALGDEKRLRILREVADGGAGLSDLTETLGVAKSTVFHHIGILRAAGLLRVHIDHSEDGAKEYRLRTEAFADADTSLHKYLEVALTHEGADR